MPQYHGLEWHQGKLIGLRCFMYDVAQTISHEFIKGMPNDFFNNNADLFRQTLVRRLVYSLHNFQCDLALMRRLSGEKSTSREDFRKAETEMEIHAENILFYTGILMDALARFLPFFFDEATDVESMSNLKRKVLEEKYLPELKPLFEVMQHDKNSWWQIGFAHKHGLRQRLMHYPDHFMLGKTLSLSILDGTKMVSIHDFEAEIRYMFYDLFLWLDELFIRHINDLISKKGSLLKKKEWKPTYHTAIPWGHFLVEPQLPSFAYLPFHDTDQQCHLPPKRSERSEVRPMRDLLQNGKSVTLTIVSVKESI